MIAFLLLSMALVRIESTAPRGEPVLFAGELPRDLVPGTVRVRAGGAVAPSKLEWTNPKVRVAWISTGAPVYELEYQTGASGPHRGWEPAKGNPLLMSRGRAGRSGRRKIELVDWDGDGDLDLLTDSDRGVGWYENTGTRERPVMVWRGELLDRDLSGHNATPNTADWNGDGKPDLIVGAEDGFLYFYEHRFLRRQVRK